MKKTTPVCEKTSFTIKPLPPNVFVDTPVGFYELLANFPRPCTKCFVIRNDRPLNQNPYDSFESAVEARDADYRERMSRIIRDGWITITEHDSKCPVDMVFTSEGAV